MSLETLIQNLTAALEANTAAILGAGGQTATTTAAAAPEKTTKTTKAADKPAKTTKPKRSIEEASSLLLELKDGHGIQHAKDILAAHGVAKMAEMPADKAEAIYDAAKAKLEELAAGAGADAEDEDGI